MKDAVPAPPERRLGRTRETDLWMREHATEIVAKWIARPLSEARGDVTFLGRQLNRERAERTSV